MYVHTGVTSRLELLKQDQPEAHDSKVLDLLNVSQYLQVSLFGEFHLPRMIADKRLHGLVPFGDWFDELNVAQRTQVIEYFNVLLERFKLKLVSYGRGPHYGYQFTELP